MFRIPPQREGKPVAVGVSIIRAVKEKLFAIKEKQSERVDIKLNFPVVGLVCTLS